MYSMNRPFVEWKVGGKVYKLKLTTLAIVMIEKRYNCSIIEKISGTVPELDFVATLIWYAAQVYHPELTLQQVYDLLEEYFEENDFKELIKSVYDEIFETCGFFGKTEKQKEATPKN